VTSEATNKTTAYTARVQEEQGKAQLKVEQYKTDLERYASRVESALSEFSQKSTINIQEYTSKVQEGLQKYSSKSESSLGKFSAQVQQAVAEEQRKVSEFTAKSTQELQSFGADIQSYASQTQAEIQSFGAKLQKASAYLAKAATLMQVVGELNAECQMAQQDSQDYYQRAVNELRAISGVLTAPPQQQSEQRQEQGATS
jgi:methyl-accepting chemotaxis protein